MNNSIKRFGIGLIGGMIPLSFFLFFSNSSAKNHVDSRIQNGGEQNGQAINFNGSMEIAAENFIAASENSLNSVVHVTTTVETTSFHEMFFQNSFMDLVLVDKNLNNMDLGVVLALLFLKMAILLPTIT